MRVLVYGGTFNPPHLGHRHCLVGAIADLCPDRTIVIPDYLPPHKELSLKDYDPADRLHMTRLAFSDIASISDTEIKRGSRSYTSDTLTELKEEYPEDTLIFLMGTDMFMSIDRWVRPEVIMEKAELAVLARNTDEEHILAEKAAFLKEKFGAVCHVIGGRPFPCSSSEIREKLPEREGAELLDEKVYAYIIKKRLYSARPDFVWLRKKALSYLKPKRIPHVLGVEGEARRLALKWGEDPDTAAEAGLLHDVTKKLNLEEHLKLVEKYEQNFERLLHAPTVQYISREIFGVDDEVFSAIYKHTCGDENMTLLEKIIYLADYVEPNRDFEGVNELRALCYEDIDKAMLLGLTMTLEEISSKGYEPHRRSLKAAEYYRKLTEGR
ncbi:MAG: nicotinate (nicotinamide) nucleotide adenylyltransferase [Oscillospiraceae bacterium]|nr:nicotinate (nicotinamide) nucleotide adenylyltransferase [Oscillospiraceae bacterium]